MHLTQRAICRALARCAGEREQHAADVVASDGVALHFRADVAHRLAQRFTAALPELARIVAPGDPDWVHYAIAGAAEEELRDLRHRLKLAKQAQDAISKSVTRLCREALESEDHETMRRALETLVASSEVADAAAE